MPNMEETLQTARRNLEDLEDFLKANPNLESEIRHSMAETFATVLAMESMKHPELYPPKGPYNKPYGISRHLRIQKGIRGQSNHKRG